MELHERLGNGKPVAPERTDPFAQLKNEVHMSVIGELGRELFDSELDDATLRRRVGTVVTERLN